QYVDDQIIQVKAFVDQQLAAHIAAADPHKQYAPKASPALTGTPTAPTAAQTVNNTQIATTGFVKSAIAALVASSPAALDTLNELAAALGNDPNFATTVTNALAGKQPLDSTLTNLSGKTVNGILQYLGLGEAAKRNVGTGENQIPDMSAYSSGSGWQKLPDGSIEQWGRINFPYNAAAVSTNVTFTIPFTQEPDVVIVYDGGFGGGNMWGATNWTKTGFVAHCNYGFEGGAFYAKGR
ncbi:phage tail protein, partial [Escherichia coli]